jgi:hypothetical protein
MALADALDLAFDLAPRSAEDRMRGRDDADVLDLAAGAQAELDHCLAARRAGAVGVARIAGLFTFSW